MRRWLLALSAVAVLGWASAAPAQQTELRNRWLFIWPDPADQKLLETTLANMARASASGYTGVVLNWPTDPNLSAPIKAAAAKYHLDLIPKVMSKKPNRNYWEGLPVKDAVFVVHDGQATLVPDPALTLPGGDFEQAKDHVFAGWDAQDRPGESSFQDTRVRHAGGASARIDSPASVTWNWRCHFSREVPVKPYHQYRVSVWIKSELCTLTPDFGVEGLTGRWSGLSFFDTTMQPTQDWKLYQFIFNSLDNAKVRLYFGARGSRAGGSGSMWLDDATIEEVGLLNVLRRAGTPVVVKGEDGAVYTEGTDYEPIADPELNLDTPGHPQPPIRLAKGSRLQEGQHLLVSYYHPLLIHYGGTTCLTAPEVFDCYREDVKRINDDIHPPAFFMQHDEIRLANWCETCRGKHETPGQLLADNVKRCTEIIKGIRPDAKIWVWSDMFDPFHNAHENYYLVDGTWAASWEGLPKEVGVVNWYFRRNRNFYWFSMRGHEQILSFNVVRHDDSGEGAKAVVDEARGFIEPGRPGIAGVMYCTWDPPNYGAIETWAAGMWGPAK